MTNNFIGGLKNAVNPLKCRLVADQKKVKPIVFLLSS
jgi:hypothetical protein